MTGTAAEFAAILVATLIVIALAVAVMRLARRRWPPHEFANYPDRPLLIDLRLVAGMSPQLVIFAAILALLFAGQGSFEEHLRYWLRFVAFAAPVALLGIVLGIRGMARPPGAQPVEARHLKRKPSYQRRVKLAWVSGIGLVFLIGWIVAGQRPAPTLDRKAIATGVSLLKAFDEGDRGRVQEITGGSGAASILDDAEDVELIGAPRISVGEGLLGLHGPYAKYEIEVVTIDGCRSKWSLHLYMKMDWRSRWHASASEAIGEPERC